MNKLVATWLLLIFSVFLLGHTVNIKNYTIKETNINKSNNLSINLIYHKDDNGYFQDSKPLIDKKTENKIFNLYKNKNKIRALVDKKYFKLFDNFFSDINNCFYIDSKTHKKEFIVGKYDLKISEILGKSLDCEPAIDGSFYQCIMWKQLANKYIYTNNISSAKEKNRIYELYRNRHIFYDINFSLDIIAYSYLHKNICRRINEIEKWKKSHRDNNEFDIYELKYLSHFKGKCK